MADNIDFALNDHFYDWNYKFYFLVGGYGSSKSYHVAVKLIKKLLEEKRKALVVREVFDTIRDSCYDLLQEVAEAMGVDGYLTFTSSPMQVKFSNGSRIIFKGMDKPAKLKKKNKPETKIAFLEDGNIYIETLDKDVMDDIKL